MGSQFRSQVVPALQYVAGKALELGIEVKIIFYDDRAEVVEFTRENYMAVLGKLDTRGSTSFAAAFAAVTQALSSFKSTTFGEVVVAFMTDGCNNCGSFDAPLATLKSKLRELQTSKNIR